MRKMTNKKKKPSDYDVLYCRIETEEILDIEEKIDELVRMAKKLQKTDELIKRRNYFIRVALKNGLIDLKRKYKKRLSRKSKRELDTSKK